MITGSQFYHSALHMLCRRAVKITNSFQQAPRYQSITYCGRCAS